MAKRAVLAAHDAVVDEAQNPRYRERLNAEDAKLSGAAVKALAAFGASSNVSPRCGRIGGGCCNPRSATRCAIPSWMTSGSGPIRSVGPTALRLAPRTSHGPDPPGPRRCGPSAPRARTRADSRRPDSGCRVPTARCPPCRSSGCRAHRLACLPSSRVIFSLTRMLNELRGSPCLAAPESRTASTPFPSAQVRPMGIGRHQRRSLVRRGGRGFGSGRSLRPPRWWSRPPMPV